MDVAAGATEPIGHPAQHGLVDQVILVGGRTRPTVVTPGRNGAIALRVRADRHRSERRQSGSADKRHELPPLHPILSLTSFSIAARKSVLCYTT
jgi:hypothetical protein